MSTVTGGPVGQYQRQKWSCGGRSRGRSYRLLTGLLNSGHEAHQRQLRGDLHGGRRGRKWADWQSTSKNTREIKESERDQRERGADRVEVKVGKDKGQTNSGPS